MMVPRIRLIALAAIVLIPSSIFGLMAPGATLFAVTAIALLLVVAAFDAAFAVGRLGGVAAALPEVVRMTEDREAAIDVSLRQDDKRRLPLRLGIRLPRQLTSPFETLSTTLLTDAETVRVSWPCTASHRGRYALRGVFLETPSPAGLWAVRGRSETECEVRVYPDIMKERKHVAALFLNRGSFGVHAQRQVGRGREFEKLREYISGDSLDDIHWKATARRAHLVTKMYQVERTQEVYVVIDATRLSARPVQSVDGEGRTVPQLERFVDASMVLGLAAERQGDLFGVCVFSDRVEQFVRAKNGKTHYNTCRDALYTVTPRPVNPDYRELFGFIRTRLRRRALLIFLTDLDDPALAEDFIRNVDLIARHHLVLVNMLTPPGTGPLFSGGELSSADAVYDRLASHIQWRELREVQAVLHQRGVTMSILDNEHVTPQLVTQYINVKQRQIL